MSLPSPSPAFDEYDAVIIGAGMSGLAAAIRLSMFGRKVCILEKHTVPGGLNSYYQRGKRKFDVGLHALTNFCGRLDRKKPLNRLLRQLRLSYEDLKLHEQVRSKIQFPQMDLFFSNDFTCLSGEIESKFPHQGAAFAALVDFIRAYNELDLGHPYQSARKVLSTFITDQRLLEMLLCPLLIYGSAWERDMDWTQFVVMFKSIYLQGFARPAGGVRTIVELLLARLREEGGELIFGQEVVGLHAEAGKISAVELGSGRSLKTSLVISSIGHPETMRLCPSPSGAELAAREGGLSFTEALMVMKEEDLLAAQTEKNTIVFYNENQTYEYRRPQGLVDPQSAVICFPDNYSGLTGESLLPAGESLVRVTMLANADLWWELPRDEYRKAKEQVFEDSLALVKKCLPRLKGDVLFKDVFTPKTIFRYTGHLRGAVYGSPDKLRDGKTPLSGLYLCGTDQGFLGIVGSMLSGITVANLYGLGGDVGTIANQATNDKSAKNEKEEVDREVFL